MVRSELMAGFESVAGRGGGVTRSVLEVGEWPGTAGGRPRS